MKSSNPILLFIFFILMSSFSGKQDSSETKSGIYLTENDCYMFNCGDSRIYEFFNGTLNKLTKDHFLASSSSIDSATNWKRKSFESSTNNAFDLKRLAATVAIAFFVSPMTVLRDPWLQERRQRSAVITSSIYQDIIGRLISRSEALRIARNILEKALIFSDAYMGI